MSATISGGQMARKPFEIDIKLNGKQDETFVRISCYSQYVSLTRGEALDLVDALKEILSL